MVGQASGTIPVSSDSHGGRILFPCEDRQLDQAGEARLRDVQSAVCHSF